MTHRDPLNDANRWKPGPPGQAPGGPFPLSGNADWLASLQPSSEADGPAKRATDDAWKRELLREAVEWDDLNDRIAPIGDDTEG
jgi:hypothetical protein